MMNYERLEEEERMKRARAQQALDDAKYVIRLSEMSDLELSNELDEVESTIYGGGHFVVAEAVKRLRRPSMANMSASELEHALVHGRQS